MAAHALAAADGQWPRLLIELAGLAPEQLQNRHQPCPACGGTDRYRWDQDDGPGGWFCNQCGGKDHSGGGGNGLDLLMRVSGWDFATAARRVEAHLGLPAAAGQAQPQPLPPPQLLALPSPDLPRGPAPGQRASPSSPPARPQRRSWAAPPPSGATATARAQPLFWVQRLDLQRGGQDPQAVCAAHLAGWRLAFPLPPRSLPLRLARPQAALPTAGAGAPSLE